MDFERGSVIETVLQEQGGNSRADDAMVVRRCDWREFGEARGFRALDLVDFCPPLSPSCSRLWI